MLVSRKRLVENQVWVWSLSLLVCMALGGCATRASDESEAYYRDEVVKPIEEDSPVGKAIRISDQQEYALDATTSSHYNPTEQASPKKQPFHHVAVSVGAPAIPLDIQSAPVPTVAAESLGGDTAPVRPISGPVMMSSPIFRMSAPQTHIHIPHHVEETSSGQDIGDTVSHLHIPKKS